MANPDVAKSLGTFTFKELDPPASRPAAECIGWLTRAPVVVAGYGGWSRVARPRRIALTEWVGRDAMSLEIPFLFDAYGDDDVEDRGMWIEEQIRALERLAGIDEDDPEPPVFQLTSKPPKLIPHNERRASQVDWFVDALTWDADSVIVLNSGNRVRAAGTVTITQYVKDERLRKSAAQRHGKKSAKKGGRRKSYTVKKGDTLSKIAARKDVYGDASRWRDIKKANGIRDPKNLKTGKVLKIP